MLVAVITGSSSGIGRQTAIEFAKSGYALVLHARQNVVGLQAVAAESMAAGAPKVLCITANIASAAACKNLVEAAFAWQESVDVWINNAGADVLTGRAGSLNFEDRLTQLLNVDIAGTIRVSRDVAKRLREQAPSDSSRLPTIINVGWDQANLGMEGEPGQLFCTSKAAVMAFTQSLAMSCGPSVRVNCVAPGWIKTAWGEQAASEYWERRATGESLLQRWGTPKDVARTMLWLASSEAQFVNGQTISVNGGRRFTR